MISRPLSPLRNTTRSRPPPAGASFVVSQCTRKPPVSLVNVSVCLSPRPDQAPIGFQTTIDSGRGACSGPAAASGTGLRPGRRAPVSGSVHEFQIPNSYFQIPRESAHHSAEMLLRRLQMMKTLAVAVGVVTLAHRASCRRADLHERRRADSAEVLSELSSPRTDGADVADDLSGRPAVGAIDQAARDRAADAAVGHRSARRHPELQERSVAARRRDPDDREVGRRRRADGQRRRHAEAARLRRRGSLAHRQARCDRHLAETRRAGRGGRLVGQLLRRDRPHRGPLHQGDREQAGQDRRRPPPADLRRGRRHDGRQQRRRQQSRKRRASS